MCFNNCFSQQGSYCCSLNKHWGNFKSRIQDICHFLLCYLHFLYMVKNKNSSQCFLKQACWFDMSTISLESENTPQYCWKSPPFYWNIRFYDSDEEHVNNLMVFQRIYKNTLQYEEILTLLIFTLSYQLLQLFSFLVLHLSLPLFNVILKRKERY